MKFGSLAALEDIIRLKSEHDGLLALGVLQERLVIDEACVHKDPRARKSPEIIVGEMYRNF